MASRTTRHSRSAGFTLVEVSIAVAVMAIVSAAIAALFGIVIAAGRASRDRTIAVTLAIDKLEQLRSLEWRAELGPGLVITPRTDLQSNLSVDPVAGGGPGLAESPPGTLDGNTPPYVDYLNSRGQWAGTGPSPPPHSVYIRRWAAHRLSSDPDRSVALQVLVTTVAREGSRVPGVPHAWNGEDVLLATMMTRRVR